MTTLNISLPDTLQEFLENRIAEGGYPTASNYLRDLVQDDQRRKAQANLDALLQEGLDSGPATPMTPQDWDEIRRVAEADRPSFSLPLLHCGNIPPFPILNNCTFCFFALYYGQEKTLWLLLMPVLLWETEHSER